MHNDISFPHSSRTLDTHCLLQERSCKIDTAVITVESFALEPQTLIVCWIFQQIRETYPKGHKSERDSTPDYHKSEK